MNNFIALIYLAVLSFNWHQCFWGIKCHVAIRGPVLTGLSTSGLRNLSESIECCASAPQQNDCVPLLLATYAQPLIKGVFVSGDR